MRFERLRLDEVLRRDVAVAWHEGVAVIQAICRELPDATNVGARFPLAAEVSVSPEGIVSLLRSPSGSPGVTAAGQLLGEMLQADVPVRLRLIQSEAVATTPAFNTLKDLSEALAYFERPDGQQLIQQVYARAGATPSRRANAAAELAVSELEDLKDFLPETSPSAPAVPAAAPMPVSPPDAEPHLPLVKPEPGQPMPVQHGQPHAHEHPYRQEDEGAGYQPARRQRAGWIAVAAVIAFAVVASGALLTYGREQTAGPEEEVEQVEPPTNSPAAAGKASAAKASKPATAGSQAPKNRPNSQPDVRTTVERSPRSAGVVELRSGAGSPASPDVIATTLKSEPVVADPSWAAALPLIVREPLARPVPVPGATDMNGQFVYSRANSEVVPPVAIRPHLPSEPPPDYASEHLMVLDLVVTSKGDVESVRLLTVPKTINDFMIVSAAKAWLFAPAKLNGRAVKYKHRIRFVVP